MNEILTFIKDIFMINTIDKTPIGLCQFDCDVNTTKKNRKIKQKKKLRLSELMAK